MTISLICCPYIAPLGQNSVSQSNISLLLPDIAYVYLLVVT